MGPSPAASARGSAALKPLAQLQSPVGAEVVRPIGLCMLSPMASASGGVAIESLPRQES